MNKFFDKITFVFHGSKKHVYILVLIVLVGAFLRMYEFHDWLYFYPDQARDVMITDNVLNGNENWPLLGPIAASTPFKLGPIYYYFQIISGMIFGSSPASMAYPDLLFGILSIPIMFYLLKNYFNSNFSLALTGLYAVSFYAVRYSRFAWNSNPIPFFVILFLLSLLELLHNKEKTHWKWIISIGVTLGVGVQLHTVLLILLPTSLVTAFIYLWNNNGALWKKWFAIFLIALSLNMGQIISEFQTGFRNSWDFLSVLNDRSVGETGGVVESFVLDIVCHAQANTLYLTSLENNDTCDTLSYLKRGDSYKQSYQDILVRFFNIIFGSTIFFLGYWLLFSYSRNEQDGRKKIFLKMILVYGVFTFLIIFPIIAHNGQVRYWLPIIFLPYVFLGLIVKYLSEKFRNRRGNLLILSAVILLMIANLFTISSEASEFSQKTRSNAQYVVLGEIEEITQYIIADSYPQKSAYIYGGQKYVQNYYKPLFYLASKENFTIARGGRHIEEIPSGIPVYFIGNNLDSKQSAKYPASPDEFGFTAIHYKIIGNIVVYRLKN